LVLVGILLILPLYESNRISPLEFMNLRNYRIYNMSDNISQEIYTNEELEFLFNPTLDKSKTPFAQSLELIKQFEKVNSLLIF
jgi:hypothetical protein